MATKAGLKKGKSKSDSKDGPEETSAGANDAKAAEESSETANATPSGGSANSNTNAGPGATTAAPATLDGKLDLIFQELRRVSTQNADLNSRLDGVAAEVQQLQKGGSQAAKKKPDVPAAASEGGDHNTRGKERKREQAAKTPDPKESLVDSDLALLGGLGGKAEPGKAADKAKSKPKSKDSGKPNLVDRLRAGIEQSDKKDSQPADEGDEDDDDFGTEDGEDAVSASTDVKDRTPPVQKSAAGLGTIELSRTDLAWAQDTFLADRKSYTEFLRSDDAFKEFSARSQHDLQRLALVVDKFRLEGLTLKSAGFQELLTVFVTLYLSELHGDYTIADVLKRKRTLLPPAVMKQVLKEASALKEMSRTRETRGRDTWGGGGRGGRGPDRRKKGYFGQFREWQAAQRKQARGGRQGHRGGGGGGGNGGRGRRSDKNASDSEDQ